ncbi:MAG: DUF3540 domain-containing protein [Polyangiaceae bacterium]|nr:DUF3540 domain-containing protein [Polyangiaceae bacterium]
MNLAQKLNPDAAALSAGHVERCEGSVLVIRSEGAVVRARRAPACLLAPEVGDRVLLAHTGEGRAYVLSVLERDEEAPHRWTADGDVSIEARAGRVDVVGETGAAVRSPAEVAVQAKSISLRSKAAKFAIGKLGLIGEEVVAEISRSKLVSSTIESLAQVVTQTASRVSRIVTEIEHVRAGTVDMAAEKSLMIHAENAMVTAKALVKMDGEAVQLG